MLIALYFFQHDLFAAKYLYKSKGGVYKFKKFNVPAEYLTPEPIREIKFFGPLERDPVVLATIREASKKYRIDESLIMAVIKAESNFRNNAVSPAGAEGIMQMMPSTAIRYGVLNTFNYRENIFGGTRYLRFLLNTFMGNIQLALAAYNAGEGAVFKYGTIPPFNETQQYVKRVIAFYNAYTYKKFKEMSDKRQLVEKRSKRNNQYLANSLNKERKMIKTDHEAAQTKKSYAD